MTNYTHGPSCECVFCRLDRAKKELMRNEEALKRAFPKPTITPLPSQHAPTDKFPLFDAPKAPIISFDIYKRYKRIAYLE